MPAPASVRTFFCITMALAVFLQFALIFNLSFYIILMFLQNRAKFGELQKSIRHTRYTYQYHCFHLYLTSHYQNLPNFYEFIKL